MANSILTSNVRVPFLVEVETNLPVLANGTTQYNKNFVGGNGTSIDILKPTYGNTASTNSDLTSNLGDVQGGAVSLALSQYSKGVSLTQVEQTLALSSYEDQVAKPQARLFASDLQRVGINALRLGASNVTVQTNTATYSYLGDGVAAIESSRANGDLFGVMSPKIAKQVIDSGLSFFQADIKSSFTSGALGGYMGAMWYKSPDMAIETLVTGAQTVTNCTVTGTYAAGATTLNLTATALTGTFKKGQAFTVAGCYNVDVFGNATDTLYAFTLQADVTASGNAAAANIKGVYASGPLKNISALPVATNAVTFLHAGSSVYQDALVWDKQAFVTAFAKLKPMANTTNRGTEGKLMNVLCTVAPDALKFQEIVRWDVLMGFVTLYPQLVSRVSFKTA